MRALVAMASRHGSTVELSRAIAQVLRGYQVQVETSAVDRVADLRRYGAVVLGSAVYQGSWTDAARIFVTQHEDALCRVPLWLFSSGPVGGRWYDELPEEVSDLHGRLRARSHRVFSGRLDRGLLSDPERGALGPGGPRGADDRDWGAVRSWARGIAESLTDPDRCGCVRSDR